MSHVHKHLLVQIYIHATTRGLKFPKHILKQGGGKFVILMRVSDSSSQVTFILKEYNISLLYSLMTKVCVALTVCTVLLVH